MTDEQKALQKAYIALKDFWPKDNRQISINLCKDHDNVNYNVKYSGIFSPERIANGS